MSKYILKKLTALIAIFVVLLGMFQVVGAEGETPDLTGLSVVETEDFGKAERDKTVDGYGKWSLAGDGFTENFAATAVKNPDGTDENVLKLKRTASSGFSPAVFTFADSEEKELKGKVYISMDMYVSEWSSFNVQVQTSNGTALVHAYINPKYWYNNAGWKRLAPKDSEFRTNEWFTLGIYLDTELGTYDLYLNDTTLTGGLLEKQGSADLLTKGRGAGKLYLDVYSGQASGEFYVDNISVHGVKTVIEDPFENLVQIKKEDFSKAIEDTAVHGYNGFTTVGSGAVTEFTSKIAKDPKNSENKALLFKRTAVSGLSPTTFTFADDEESELTGKMYISMDMYVSEWSSFNVQVQTSNGTALVHAYINPKYWYNNAGWKRLAPNDGEFCTNEWFTLGIYLDTEVGTYDIYLNDASLTSGKLKKQGSADLLTKGRGAGKILFDIISSQSAGEFFVDNLEVLGIKKEADDSDNPSDENNIKGYEILAKEDFTVDTPSSIGQSVVGWSNFSVRNAPLSPALYWTIEDDTQNTSGLPFKDGNKVLRARRTKVGNANEWLFYSLKNNSVAVEARVEVHVKFRLKQESAENNFIFRVRNNGAADGWGNSLVSFLIRPSGTIIDTTNGWGGGIGSFSPKKWNDIDVVINTETKKFDLFINGQKTNSESLNITSNGEGYDPYVSVIDLDIEKTSKGENVWYIDDLMVYKDYTEELAEIAESIKQSVKSCDVSENIALDGFTLPQGYTVKWESSNPDAVSNEGKITRRAFSQTAELTAKIIKDAETVYVQNASAECKFTFNVLPKEGMSDSDFVEELKNSYYTEALLTDEPLDKITKDIAVLNSQEFDGVTLLLESDDPSINCETGEVTRPLPGEEAKTVKLTLKISKNEAEAVKEFILTVLPEESDEKLLTEAVKWLENYKFTSENVNLLKYGITLPKECENGVQISWSSDKPEVMSTEGKITRGEENSSVTLTATLAGKNETKTVNFSFTVCKSAEAMLSEDFEKLLLNTDNPESVTESFKVDTNGLLNNSQIVWSSDKTEVISVKDGTLDVARPLFSEGDAVVTLTAVLRNETKAVTKTFTVTVPALPSDEALVSQTESWLTWERISLDAKNSVKRNLALPLSYDYGVLISWESSDEEVVSAKGEVLNPAVGDSARKVTLKAEISKNEIKAEKVFEFTVSPFETIDELLNKAVNNLSFNALSSQAINEVTENLTLPKIGAGGSSISWFSSDESVISVGEDTEGLKGIIKRPEADGNDAYVTLTAIIEYSGESKKKNFLITVKPKEEWVEIYRHSFEEFDSGTMPLYSWGEPTWPSENYATYYVENDPTGAENKAVRLLKKATDSYASGEAWYFLRHAGYALYNGELIFSGRIYVDDALRDTLMFDIVGKNGSQVCLLIDHDRKIRFQVIEGGAVFYSTKEPCFVPGKWMDFKIEMDSVLKSYNIYIDGKCITASENVHLDGNNVNLPWGMPYNYYQDPTKSVDIQGFRMYFSGVNNKEDTYVYFDDFSFSQKSAKNAKLLEAKSQIERDLLSAVNPNSVTSSFKMPQLGSSGVKVKWYSSDATALLSDGTVFVGDEDKKVTLTAELTLGTDTVYRPFVLTIKSKYSSDEMSDKEIVDSDTSEILENLKNNYNISALTENLSLPEKGNYGSSLSWSSSDSDIITDTGRINRKKGMQSAVLTLTASYGKAVKEEKIEICLANIKSSSSSSAMVVSGANSTGKTGIVLKPDKSDDKKEKAFIDVPESHIAFEAVSFLKDKKIVSGVGENRFEPDRTITRAEFAKMAVVAFNLVPDRVKNPEFSDVSKQNWYYQYVRTLSALDFIKGMGDGSFGADKNINIQDAALILHRIMTAEGFEFKADAELDEEGVNISEYAKEQVKQLLSENILSKDEKGNINGSEPATRAQIAMMLYKSLIAVD